MKILKAVLAILLGLAVLAGTFMAGAAGATYYIIRPCGGSKPVRVDIPKDAYASQVAQILEKAGVIKNAGLFKMAVKFTNSERDLKPGTYLVDPNSNMMEILNNLKKGQGKMRLVTIPEGLVIREIAEILERDSSVDKEQFAKVLASKKHPIDGKTPESLEGYLLPDTYDFPESYTAADIVKTMTDAFNSRVVPLYHQKKDGLPRKMSLNEVIVLASMVEREAQVPSERPKIAQVYYNRLQRGMRLECDATVQFALGKQKQVLKYSDLEVDSPYNTYKINGLPPGPIANPGIDSISAVLDPEPHPYLFYVRNDVQNDGSHAFARTFAEHQENIRKYQR